jgi:hypothetical protein
VAIGQIPRFGKPERNLPVDFPAFTAFSRLFSPFFVGGGGLPQVQGSKFKIPILYPPSSFRAGVSLGVWFVVKASAFSPILRHSNTPFTCRESSLCQTMQKTRQSTFHQCITSFLKKSSQGESSYYLQRVKARPIGKSAEDWEQLHPGAWQMVRYLLEMQIMTSRINDPTPFHLT